MRVIGNLNWRTIEHNAHSPTRPLLHKVLLRFRSFLFRKHSPLQYMVIQRPKGARIYSKPLQGEVIGIKFKKNPKKWIAKLENPHIKVQTRWTRLGDSMSKFSLLSVAISLFVTGCGANFNTVSRSTAFGEDGKAIHLDAYQRVLVTKNGRGNFGEIACAEPKPGAITAGSSSFGLALGASAPKGPQGSGAGGGAASQTSASTALRTQSTELLRETLFRICEGFYNNALEKQMVMQLHERFQDVSLAIIAIEQLTGVTAAPAAMLGGSGQFSGTGNSAVEQGGQATQGQPSEAAASVTGAASVIPTPTGGLSPTSSEGIKYISAAVENIVGIVVDKDHVRNSCLVFISQLENMKFSPNEKSTDRERSDLEDLRKASVSVGKFCTKYLEESLPIYSKKKYRKTNDD